MSHDQEFDRTRSHTTADFDTSDVEPNRITASSKLDAPSHPVASGLLSRKARDDNGVSQGADSAVAAASSSSGSALPDTLMRKFEGSLGADLSSVRLHTGAESQSAAEAVGAKAYTMGQDIHFGAGHYDPSSAAGEHLLAHEVAHTVQQAGSTPTRQNKLEVSSPFDAAEHEADRAADAMVSGGTFAVSRAAGSTNRSVQRLNKTVPTPGWGGTNNGKITFNPNASVSVNGQNQPYWFQSSEKEEVEVTPDSRGTIVINNPYYWNFDELVTTPGLIYGTNTSHKTSFGEQPQNSVTATYTVDKDGKIAFTSVSENGSVGVPPLFEGSTKGTPTAGQDEGSLTLSTILKCTRSVSVSNGTTSESGSNVSFDVKPEGVGAGYGRTSADGKSHTDTVTSAGTGQVQKTYGIVLKVKKTPVTTKPVIQKITFDQEGQFLSGSGGIDGVNAWWGHIPEPVQTQIMLGKKPVFLYGNASKTGTAEHNQTVVANRIKDVHQKLQALTARMDIVARNTGSVQDERSVVIEVRYTPDEAKTTP